MSSNQEKQCRADQGPPLQLQSRQTSDYFHRLQTHRDDPLEKFQGVARVAHRFRRPVVGVIDYPALLVGLDALSFHHPIQSRFAVDDVGVRRAVPLKRERETGYPVSLS